jgi:hypothetical protein
MAKFLDANEASTVEMTSSRFQVGLGRLAEFKDQEGNANAPQSYVTADGYLLGVWLDTQRQHFKKNELSAERTAALEDLGVVWYPNEQAFQTGLAHLATYKDQEGNANVPVVFVAADGYPLGRWLANQRKAVKINKLSAERVAALEDLGVVWAPKAEAFQTGLAHLAAYKAQHGHVNVAQTAVTTDGYPLGVWLNTQRTAFKNNKLPVERVSALEDLGVVLDPLEEAFQTGLAHLAAYKDKAGHVNVAQTEVTADGYKLGRWLDRRRTAYKDNKLSADRVAALDALGVVWITRKRNS